MPLKQESRLVAITTALGPNVLAVRSLTVQEQISQMFQIEAELSSEDGGIDFDKVIGQSVTIRLNTTSKDKRFFNGYVSRLVQVANVGGYSHYRATIVPWLWFLTRTSDCRAWVTAEEPDKGKSVPEIIKALFDERGFSDYKMNLSGTYPKREFCVQYRETDFNFVNRLMEQEGIYYFFQHEDGKHTLVLADATSASKPFPNYADLTFHELAKGAIDREVVTDWAMTKEVHPVAVVLNDFDFKKPKTSLRSSNNVSRKHGKAQYEMFDYPGRYLEHTDGQTLADVRLAELQSQYEVLHGQATARGLAAGSTFKLKGHGRSEQNREYLITSVSMNMDAGEFASGGESGGGEFFACTFSCIDKAQQFRPPRLTAKPLVQGPQTAIVTGPSGDEIYTDKYGRVKLHFHWDRHDKSDENSSCWVRVSQYWAGKSWGSIHIPRIGQEVIVEFLEGDPDRPIITGRVYNADQTVPYDLPANKTQCGVKSRSSSGGGGANYNEIQFEDKKGSEKLSTHAEKDQSVTVENDETVSIGHDRTETVGHDEKITVTNNRTEKVGVNENITIGSNRTENVGANENITIGSNRTETVGANETISIANNRTETVGQNETVTVSLTRTHSVGINEAISIGVAQQVSVGAAQNISVGTNQGVSIGGKQTMSVGKERTTSIAENDSLTVAKKLTIDVGEEIMIQTGQASINMKKDGTIVIKGKEITVEATQKIEEKAMNINSEASTNNTIKGSMITVEASGVNTIKGSLVKIN